MSKSLATQRDIEAAVNLYVAGVRGEGPALGSLEAAALAGCTHKTILERVRKAQAPVREVGRPLGGSL